MKVASWLFYVCCILTGQYVNFPFPWPNYCLTVLAVCFCILILLFLALNFLLNVGAVAFDIYAIVSCNFSHEDCGFIYHNSSLLHTLVDSTTARVEDWNNAMVTSATIAGALSYILMALVLYGRYVNCFRKCYAKGDPVTCIIQLFKCREPEHHNLQTSKPNVLVINPFNDSSYVASIACDESYDSNSGTDVEKGHDTRYGSTDRSETSSGATDTATQVRVQGTSEDGSTQYLSSLLSPKQCFYFQIVFLFNLCVFAVSVGIYITIYSHSIGSDLNSDTLLKRFDLAGLIAQFVSQFAALISCFIFSKVAYAVSNRCMDFTRCVFLVANIEKDGPEWKTLTAKLEPELEKIQDINHLAVLKAMDRKYTLLLKNSLYPYGTWFTIHWVLYTLTAFMSIAYVTDLIINERYGSRDKNVNCSWDKDPDCLLKLVHSIFFAVFHCTLFLYPCFRAASVTKARKNMIKSVSKARWQHVPATEKEAFITYLKDQNASFKISILCARLTFGFELAYLSIVVGVFGVVIKLSKL